MKLLVSAAIFFFFIATIAKADEATEISYSTLRALIDDGKVETAIMTDYGWRADVTTSDGTAYFVFVSPNTSLADYLVNAGVETSFSNPNFVDDYEPADSEKDTPLLLELFFNILPLLIFIAFFIFVLWFSQKRGRKVQDECLDRAKAINDEFLDRQQKQFETFIGDFSSLLEKKEYNG